MVIVRILAHKTTRAPSRMPIERAHTVDSILSAFDSYSGKNLLFTVGSWGGIEPSPLQFYARPFSQECEKLTIVYLRNR